ncbi:hypothetical protein FGO68_gene9576 [Halteria grandinella]|uniref:Uncharacterized protein n=1 Tax=Halteria grandinella TaxID=5974 RepID=A0A8J8NGJ4_HALGN|nr:hypothetical protein FGO68_gene9576 [Halteria grandinella]
MQKPHVIDIIQIQLLCNHFHAQFQSIHIFIEVNQFLIVTKYSILQSKDQFLLLQQDQQIHWIQIIIQYFVFHKLNLY